MTRFPASPAAMDLAVARFKRQFGHAPPHQLAVPRRIEWLGGGADCDDGLSIAAAISQQVALAAAPRTDGRIELVATSDATVERFWMSEVPAGGRAWARPVKVVLEALRQRGAPFSGFNAALHSGLPTGLDLGAAGAMRVAAALMIRQLYPYRLTERGITLPPARNARGVLPPPSAADQLQLARLATAADTDGGMPLRLVDTLTPLAGKAWSLLSLDAACGTVDVLPLPGFVMIAFEAGANDLAAEAREVAGLSEWCQTAARKLQVKSLRVVDLARLRGRRAALEPREFACASYVVGERARVTAAERVLREDDPRQFGEFIWQSNDSLRELAGGFTEETGLLLSLARRHSACVGARAIPGGVVNLVAYHQAESFIAEVSREYEGMLGASPRALVCQFAAGAGSGTWRP